MEAQTNTGNAPPQIGGRECGMIVAIGSQAFGKSVETKKTIVRYAKDKMGVKKARKVLILDSQGEYGTAEFGKYGIPAQEVKLLAVKDVYAWCRSSVIEVRRIDIKSLHIDDKLKVLNLVTQNVTMCLFILEDINKITLTLSHLKDVVSSLIGLRHVGVDVIVSFQSLRAVEPRLYDNCQYVRLHYVSGAVSAVSDKVGEPEAFSIAQLIVKKRVLAITHLYRQNKMSEEEYKKRRSFFVYVYTKPFKIDGPFTKKEFEDACVKYLAIEKKRVKEAMEITGCSREEAVSGQAMELFNEYYGNSDFLNK